MANTDLAHLRFARKRTGPPPLAAGVALAAALVGTAVTYLAMHRRTAAARLRAACAPEPAVMVWEG